MCSSVLQRRLREGDLRKVALSCRFALYLLIVGNVQVAKEKVVDWCTVARQVSPTNGQK